MTTTEHRCAHQSWAQTSSDYDEDTVRAIVDAAPLLSEAQRDKLAALLDDTDTDDNMTVGAA